MEIFVSTLIVGLYILGSYRIKILIFSRTNRIPAKVAGSLGFVASLLIAPYLVSWADNIFNAFGLAFDLGHAGLLAVIVGGIVLLIGVLSISVFWCMFFLSKKNMG